MISVFNSYIQLLPQTSQQVKKINNNKLEEAKREKKNNLSAIIAINTYLLTT
jgi:hypothetical protein